MCIYDNAGDDDDDDDHNDDDGGTLEMTKSRYKLIPRFFFPFFGLIFCLIFFIVCRLNLELSFIQTQMTFQPSARDETYLIPSGLMEFAVTGAHNNKKRNQSQSEKLKRSSQKVAIAEWIAKNKRKSHPKTEAERHTDRRATTSKRMSIYLSLNCA